MPASLASPGPFQQSMRSRMHVRSPGLAANDDTSPLRSTHLYHSQTGRLAMVELPLALQVRDTMLDWEDMSPSDQPAIASRLVLKALGSR